MTSDRIVGKFKYLVIHWAVTHEDYFITMADLHLWHRVQHGWKRYGYNTVIQPDGSKLVVTPYNDDNFIQDSEKVWGAKGVNSISRHIVFAAGPKAPIKTKQYITLLNEIDEVIKLNPDIKIVGHYQVNPTQCPGFNVPDFLRINGIPEKHIVDGKVPEYTR